MGGSSNTRYNDSRPTAIASPRSGSGDGDGTPESRCDITSLGTLRSPPPNAVAAIQVGTILSIEVTDVQGVEVLQATHATAGSAGAVDCPHEQQIIECINAGHQYQATAHRVQGAVVTVRVERIP